MRNFRTPPSPAQPTKDGVALGSEDGRLFYWLRATPSGLWVQRERRRQDSRARVIQSHLFNTRPAFERWCDADTVRFDYPGVFLRLQREGLALLHHHEHAVDTEPDHNPG